MERINVEKLFINLVQEQLNLDHRRVFGGGRVGTGLPSDVFDLKDYNGETTNIDIYYIYMYIV